MDTEKFVKDYLRALKSAVPDRTFPTYDPAWLAHWETFLPDALRLLQKENEWFSEPRECIPGVNFSEFWGTLSETDQDKLWRFVQLSVVHGLLEGDPSQTMEKVVGMFKSWWAGTGREDDEVEKILADEQTPSQLKALLDAVLESRIVTILQEVVSEIDLASMGIDIEHPETLFDAVRDPESPLVQRLMQSVQKGLEQRIASGKIRQDEITRELERIRALVQQTFGKVLNEQLFGAAPAGGPAIPASVALGTGPEARRQRMLARLQKKHREKNSDVSHKR